MKIVKTDAFLMAVTLITISNGDHERKRIAVIDTGCLFDLVIPYTLFLLLELPVVSLSGGRGIAATGEEIPLILCRANASFGDNIQLNKVYVLPPYHENDNRNNPTVQDQIENFAVASQYPESAMAHQPSVLIGLQAIRGKTLTIDVAPNGLVRVVDSLRLRIKRLLGI